MSALLAYAIYAKLIIFKKAVSGPPAGFAKGENRRGAAVPTLS
jgi:hypothetical protein